MAIQAIEPHLRRPWDDAGETTIKTVEWEKYLVAEALLEACYQLTRIEERDGVMGAEKIAARDAITGISDILSDYRFQVMDDETTCDPDEIVEGIEVEGAIRKACTIRIIDARKIGGAQ